MRQPVDKAAVLKLVADRVPRKAVAAQFGISGPRVSQIVHGDAARLARREKEARIKGEAARAAAERAAAERAAAEHAAGKVRRLAVPCDAAVTPHPIIATGGRYSDLADYAAAHGLTQAQALQLWHKERRRAGFVVQKRGAA